MITDGYIRCLQGKLLSLPSHKLKLYHHDNFNTAIRRDTRYWSDGCWSMVLVRKLRYGDGITFRCYLVSLFSSLLWNSAWYKWRQHRLLPPVNGCGVSLWAICAERSPLCWTNCYRDLSFRKSAYAAGMYNASFPYLSFSNLRCMQPRRCAPTEWDNVMVTGDCGQEMATPYRWLATRRRSLVIIWPIHIYFPSLQSTCAPVYNIYHASAYMAERCHTCRYTPIATMISWNIFSGCLFVNPAVSACHISSCGCRTAACGSSTPVLAPVVSLSTYFSNQFSGTELLEKCASHRVSTARFFLDLK